MSFFSFKNSNKNSRPCHLGRTLRIQRLENKALLTVVVDTDAYDAPDSDPGDGICDDGSGNCTLRAAIMETNSWPGHQEIVVPGGTFTLSIPGQDEDASASGDLDITDDLTIVGAGAKNTTIDAGMIDRVMHAIGVELRLSGITIANGRLLNDAGGGVLIDGGDAMITDSMFINNTAGGAGGILNRSANVTVTGSTFAGNAADGPSGDGGGIFASGGNTRIVASTFAGNGANDSGHAIRNDYGGVMTIAHCTISDPGGSWSVFNGSFDGTSGAKPIMEITHSIIVEGAYQASDLGYNIIGFDPGLGPLQDNGGATWTQELLPGSAAIDAGDPEFDTEAPGTTEFDQRGAPFARVSCGQLDIGAFELQILPGDANCDGQFDSSDLVHAFQAGEFEDSIPDNSTWSKGDWDGDGEFTTSDLVLAFQLGNFV